MLLFFVLAATSFCGFTGHGLNKGCLKCNNFFLALVGTRVDFSGFKPCPPKSNNECRLQAQEILNQRAAGECVNLEEHYGTKYIEVMFDPMHNLIIGTAKHIMKNVWLDPEKPLLDKSNLQEIQEIKKNHEVMDTLPADNYLIYN